MDPETVTAILEAKHQAILIHAQTKGTFCIAILPTMFLGSGMKPEDSEGKNRRTVCEPRQP